ncbi:L-cysteine desulfidase family protein [Acetobacterium malicum]|nr:L-serine ammonia-lyase, iron-sulfur-dependent, subunit alpha [Acetobacterium malicum]
MRNIEILEAMKKGLVVATGCTEPIAIAYAGAVARSYAIGIIQKVKLTASPNIIKNAFVVKIPGTGLSGLENAVALGVVCGEPGKKLELLNNVSLDDIEAAKRLVEEGRVEVIKSDLAFKLYIEVTITTEIDTVTAIIIGTHTNVAKIIKNNKVIHDSCCIDDIEKKDKNEISFSFEDIYEFATSADIKEMELIKKAIELNKEVSREGLRENYGLQVGKMIQRNIDAHYMGKDMGNYAMMMAAGASDARMAGVSLPVMSNSGSGNQGIGATLPVVAVWEWLEIGDQEKLIRACALSNLSTIYIKEKFGVLSALCGAVISGAGAAAGITWLLGGSLEQIESALQNTLGNVAGIICDGAKASCALKVSTCTNAAIQASLLAMHDLRIKPGEGIVEMLSEDTIDNFAILGNEGSGCLDREILKMITNKD